MFGWFKKKSTNREDRPQQEEPLRTLVQRLADEPTQANQDTFYRALVAAQVAVPLREFPPGYVPGNAVADGRLGIPSTCMPDGSAMLLVYTDYEAALQSPQAKAGFCVAGRAVLEMALTNRIGVIVSTGTGAAPAWSGVPAENVAKVLAMAK